MSCCQGQSSTPGCNFLETFSHVVKPTTVLVLLTLTLAKNWSLRQLDFNNAFMNGNLKEDFYMLQHPIFVKGHSSSLVCKLSKALYRLKQVPRAWSRKLGTAFQSFEFLQSESDLSFFLRCAQSFTIYLLAYVDHIIITSNNNIEINAFVRQLHAMFSLKDLGSLNYFLGIEVTNGSNGIILSHHKYI